MTDQGISQPVEFLGIGFVLMSLLRDLTKLHIKVKSGDLSIIHDHIVMARRKLSSDWLNTSTHENK